MHLILTALSVAFGKKVVITIHDQWFADDYRQLRGFKRLAARLCYASAARIIAVNAQTDFLFVPTTRIVHIPAFLPPTSDEADPSALPPAIHELRARMKVVLTANAYRILFHKGQDLYGLDLSIDLMGRIIGTGNRDVGFIFVIPDVRHPDYLDAMRTRLKDLGLLDRFLILTQPLPYPAVIDICDVFLRPTTSDGDAISLREALYAGVPAIASDAVRRPEGTILFRNRDIDDLFSKAMTAITDCRAGRRRERARFAHCGEQILEVYRALGASV
jgi:glycosyltransferase involved in cell wall biosynthesis